MHYTSIPDDLLEKACIAIDNNVHGLPFKYRSVLINEELIKVTMEILNQADSKVLAQNCRKERREKTPDGLDRRIKECLDKDTMVASFISDVLQKAGIVEISGIDNPKTGNKIKATRLLEQWAW